MDFTTRNDTFLENENMIRRVMRRNLPLIHALRLEWDDVYQELAIAALHAIDSFDPKRAECIRAHIWMQLQYAILTIKRRNRPCGITCFGKQRPTVLSLEYTEEMGYSPTVDPWMEECELSPQMRQALPCLDESERRAVIAYLNGQETRRKKVLQTALNKIRGSITNATGQKYVVHVW